MKKITLTSDELFTLIYWAAKSGSYAAKNKLNWYDEAFTIFNNTKKDGKILPYMKNQLLCDL